MSRRLGHSGLCFVSAYRCDIYMLNQSSPSISVTTKKKVSYNWLISNGGSSSTVCSTLGSVAGLIESGGEPSNQPTRSSRSGVGLKVLDFEHHCQSVPLPFLFIALPLMYFKL